ncbi:hypothetical protein EB796_015355 [Bugula neritina]|uniref:Uncharacterized protein n=1 Tax=Bugula neritina TaxID=10212 RepID=A0A7J7JJV7_BUGNE|nr:hypothetical protein EB796_015355 [Bugula neritina]
MQLKLSMAVPDSVYYCWYCHSTNKTIKIVEKGLYYARITSHDTTSQLYSCIKGKYQTKLFSQLTNAAEVI